MQQLDGKIPGGPLAEKWDRHRMEIKLINPANRRRFSIIVVGTGLALIAFNRIIQKTNALFASTVTYIIPLFATMWGWLDDDHPRLPGKTLIDLGRLRITDLENKQNKGNPHRPLGTICSFKGRIQII